MRNAVLTTILIVILTISIVMVYSIENTTTRKNELEANISTAMERTLELMTADGGYVLERKDDTLIEETINNFLVKTKSKSSFDIEILGADANKGLLSVKVTETYPSLLSSHSVTVKKTIIQDKYDSRSAYECVVTYYQNYQGGKFSNPIAEYTVKKGSEFNVLGHAPIAANKKGFTQNSWAKEDGSAVASGDVKINENLKVYATYTATLKDENYIYIVSDNDVVDTIKVEAGDSIGAFTQPSKDGCVITGYKSTEEECLDYSYITKIVPSSDMIFEAQYEDLTKACTVILYDEYSNYWSKSDVNAGTVINVSGLTPPSKSGYTFKAWVNTKTNAVVSDSITVNEVIRLRATYVRAG